MDGNRLFELSQYFLLYFVSLYTCDSIPLVSWFDGIARSKQSSARGMVLFGGANLRSSESVLSAM